MFHVIRPLATLTLHEVCELAKQAAQDGVPLKDANPFEDTHMRAAFDAAYLEHADSS